GWGTSAEGVGPVWCIPPTTSGLTAVPLARPRAKKKLDLEADLCHSPVLEKPDPVNHTGRVDSAGSAR
ncbi:MAG: hypothetical protein ABSA97_13960, partial [Verrucomicrobiia bacterium]